MDESLSSQQQHQISSTDHDQLMMSSSQMQTSPYGSSSSATSSICSSPISTPGGVGIGSGGSNISSIISAILQQQQQSEPIFINSHHHSMHRHHQYHHHHMDTSSSNSSTSTSPPNAANLDTPTVSVTAVNSQVNNSAANATATAVTGSFTSQQQQLSIENKNIANSEDYLDCSSMSELEEDDDDEDDNDMMQNNASSTVIGNLGVCGGKAHQNNASASASGSSSINDSSNGVGCVASDNNLSGSESILMQMQQLPNGTSRTNRFFPDTVVDILNKWFYENLDYPYPDESMTNVLAKEANISAKQVRKWFANKRVRSNKCYKQTFRKKECRARKETKSNETESMSSASHNNAVNANPSLTNSTAERMMLLAASYHHYHQQQQHSRAPTSAAISDNEVDMFPNTSSPLSKPPFKFNNRKVNDCCSTNTTSKTGASSLSSSVSSCSSLLSSSYTPTSPISQQQTHRNHHHHHHHHQPLTNLLHHQHQQPTQHHDQHDQHQLNHQRSSSSDTNSDQEITASYLSNNNNSVFEAQMSSQTSQQQQQSHDELYLNLLRHLIETNTIQTPTSNYNPYHLLITHLLQGQNSTAASLAIQAAALTGKLMQHINTLSKQGGEVASCGFGSNNNGSLKRKTHLSNCFMNDLTSNQHQVEASFHSSLHQKQRHFSCNEESLMLKNSNNTTSGVKNEPSDCCNSGVNRSVSPVFAFETTATPPMIETTKSEYSTEVIHQQLVRQLEFLMMQKQQNQLQQQTVKAELVPNQQPRKTKINFGDISDLIN